MEASSQWVEVMRSSFLELIGRLVQYLPTLIGAVGLLLLGWLAARILRALTIRLIHGLDGLLRRVVARAGVRPIEAPRRAAELVGAVIFWVAILFFLTAATQMLGLSVFSEWLVRVVEYLPTLFAGGLIVVAGVLVSMLARDLVGAGAGTAGLAQADLIGRIVQGVILAAALVIGADQIGIDVSFLVTVLAVVLGATLGGAALAFALGARTLVSNLLAVHYLRSHYRIGQRIRIDGIEGRIVEITPVAVVIESPEGRSTLPAKWFSEQRCTRLAEDGGDGD